MSVEYVVRVLWVASVTNGAVFVHTIMYSKVGSEQLYNGRFVTDYCFLVPGCFIS